MVTSDLERYRGPKTLDVPEVAELIGISRSLAYRLAAANELPVPVLRLGEHRLKVPARPLLIALGLLSESASEPLLGAPEKGG